MNTAKAILVQEQANKGLPGLEASTVATDTERRNTNKPAINLPPLRHNHQPRGLERVGVRQHFEFVSTDA